MVKRNKEFLPAKKVFFLMLIGLFSFASTGTVHSQSIRVLIPNGGENWSIGQDKYISWSSTGLRADVRVKLELLQNGRRIGAITSNRSIRPGGTVAWKWNVGQYQGGIAAPGSGYRIRITTMDGRYTDRSDRSFRLSGGPTPSITVRSPRSSDIWYRGNSHTIAWGKTGALDSKVDIALYDGHGRYVRTLFRNTPNDETQQWRVPLDIAPGPYLIDIRTRDSFGSLVWGRSESFRITLRLAAPARPSRIRPVMALPDFTIREVYYDQTAGALKAKVRNNGNDFRGKLVISRKLKRFSTRYTEFPNLTFRRNEERALTLYAFSWPQVYCCLDYEVILDPRNEIGETNENNNRFKGRVYRTNPAPPLILVNDRVEIIGENNRVKRCPRGERITLERDDVRDYVEHHHAFAIDVRYNLKNCWGKPMNSYVEFQWRAMVKKANIHLAPGEAKWFTTRVWMLVHGTRSTSSSHLSLSDCFGRGLFGGMTTCSSSLQNWLGYPPDLRVTNISISHSGRPGSAPRVGRMVQVNCHMRNGMPPTHPGGPVQLPWKIRYEIVAPDGTVSSHHIEYHSFPSSGRLHRWHTFTPDQIGFHTVKCMADSDNNLLEFNEDNNAGEMRFYVSQF